MDFHQRCSGGGLLADAFGVSPANNCSRAAARHSDTKTVEAAVSAALFYFSASDFR